MFQFLRTFTLNWREFWQQQGGRSCPDDFLSEEGEVLELLLPIDTTEANGLDRTSSLMLKATANANFYLPITTYLSYIWPLAIQQWGFQLHKFTVSALLDAWHKWSNFLDKDLARSLHHLFEMKKAFDSTLH